MSNSELIEIDCSIGEGGGQMIRTALCLSAITKKPIRLFNIRANRPNPGLAAQHLAACKAVRSIARGTIQGADLGSQEIVFHPGEIVGGKYEFNIGTAGSVALLAQTILPILLLASKDSEIKITGGTFVQKSPGYDYFENVFLPAIERFGASVSSKIIKPGYYPAGGGIISISIKPSELKGCTNWATEKITKCIIRLSGLDDIIAIREKKIFIQNGIENVYLRRDESLSVGNCVTAWSGFCGSFVLGQKGKRSEVVAQECIDQLNLENKAIDQHLADQLLVYMALAEGESRFATSALTSHLLTNIDVISRFINREILSDDRNGNVSII
ncbi:MAG: RNA 3'-terminal phosphate cyclase [Candidatus Bilamarchaeum sp.]